MAKNITKILGTTLFKELTPAAIKHFTAKGGCILEVTTTELYIFDFGGMTPEEIAKDWFSPHALYGYHAARDGSHVGGSAKVVSITVIGENGKRVKRPLKV
jgi:hypothetical protein